jgi:hypothetical protein
MLVGSPKMKNLLHILTWQQIMVFEDGSLRPPGKNYRQNALRTDNCIQFLVCIIFNPYGLNNHRFRRMPSF